MCRSIHVPIFVCYLGTATQILVGADEGVIQANVDGTSASIIGGIYTSATNGLKDSIFHIAI